MHFAAGLTVTLVASAHALPKGPKERFPVLQPREDKDWQEIVDDAPEYLDDDEAYPNQVKTCPADAKTKDNWEHYDIATMFNTMASAEEPYTQDIQKTIMSWGYTDMTNFHCEPMQHCDATFDMEDCVSDERAAATYFWLTSIMNFNNFMTALADAVDQTHGIVDGYAGKIVEDFSTEPDDLTIPSSPGVLAAGIIGMVGSLLTGPAAIGAAMGGAMATTAVGIIGLINDGHSIELEPKFDDFADVTAYLSDASSTLQETLQDYARHVLTDTLENDRDNGIRYIDDQTGLPYIINDGSFAESIPVDRLPDSIYASLYSGAITELWNKDQIIVVKIPADESVLDAPACDESGPFVGRRHCDEDGNSYVLLRYPELGSVVPPPWTDEAKSAWMDFNGYDKLEDYGLSIEAVVGATEHAYQRNGEQSGYEWDAETAAEFLMEDENNLVQFVTFNFPFCDLWGNPDNFGGAGLEYDKVDHDDCDADCQILYAISFRCQGFFPWDHTETILWEGYNWMPGADSDGHCLPAGFVGSERCGDD